MDLKGNGALASFGNRVIFVGLPLPLVHLSVIIYSRFIGTFTIPDAFLSLALDSVLKHTYGSSETEKIMSPFPSPLASQSHGPADKTGKHLYCRELAAEQQSR